MSRQTPAQIETDVSKNAERLALVPIVGAAVFFLCVIALHLVRPELDPVTVAISYYGIGNYGFLLTVGNVALGLGVLALAYTLGRSNGTRMWRVGIAMLYASGALVILTGIFPIDAPNGDVSISGVIHVAAGNLGFFILPASLLLLAFGMRQEARWHSAFPPALALAFVLLVVSLVLIASPPEIGGLVQRALYVPYLTWVVLISAKLAWMHPRAAPTNPTRRST
jgi:hypothetical membrane protein